MCLSHPRHRGAGVHVDSPLRSTSKLTLYLYVHRLTSGLKSNTARSKAATGQEADERVGDECAPNLFLRLLSFTFRPAPYKLDLT